MSEVVVRAERAGFPSLRTVVQVDGKFAFQTSDHPEVIAADLRKLFEAMHIENVRVEP